MKPESVILISIDTLRADHLSCYGCYRLTSPNIDKMVSYFRMPGQLVHGRPYRIPIDDDIRKNLEQLGYM